MKALSVLRYADLTVFAVVALLGIGLWLQRRQKGPAAWLLRAGWLSLVLCSWFPFAALLMGTLEWQSPVRPASNPGLQAMVVLSGGVTIPEPPEPFVLSAFSTLTRCRHAAWLYANGWRMPVVVSGGDAGARGVNYSVVMDEMLRKEGIPAEAIWKEGESTSTYESAVQLARMLHPKGIRNILLVTEAYHMPRSAGLFRKAGFEVTASPCSFRTKEFHGLWQEWILLSPRFLQMCDIVLHEWMSYARSRMTGQL